MKAAPININQADQNFMKVESETSAVCVEDLKHLKPLLPGMFAFDQNGQPVALRGSRCPLCARYFFPPRQRCNHCAASATLIDVILPTRGVIHASTVSHVRSAVGHAPPYAYGYVSLGNDDVRLLAPFAGDEPSSFVPGREVRLGFGRIHASDLSATLGYYFVPTEGANDGQC